MDFVQRHGVKEGGVAVGVSGQASFARFIKLPPQTFQLQDRHWIYGLHDRIYYYKYFDQAAHVMLNPNVYQLDPVHFRIRKHISAERARWEPGPPTSGAGTVTALPTPRWNGAGTLSTTAARAGIS